MTALGIQVDGEPSLRVGTLTEQAKVQRDRSDRPPWARIVRALAWIPAAMIILAWLAWRTVLAPVRWILSPITRLFNPFRGLMPGGGVAAFGLGALTGGLGVGLFERSRKKRQVWIWELDCDGSRARARVALPEEHGYDIRDGDDVEVWGRRHHDGTIRVYRVLNRRTEESLSPRFVHPAQHALALLGVVMVVGVLAASLLGGTSTPVDSPQQQAQQAIEGTAKKLNQGGQN